MLTWGFIDLWHPRLEACVQQDGGTLSTFSVKMNLLKQRCVFLFGICAFLSVVRNLKFQWTINKNFMRLNVNLMSFSHFLEFWFEIRDTNPNWITLYDDQISSETAAYNQIGSSPKVTALFFCPPWMQGGPKKQRV